MPIPDRESIKSALVDYIRDNGGSSASLKSSEVYDGLAERFSLTADDRALERGAETFWENEVRWARQTLVEDGYILPIDQSQRGVWKLVNPTNAYKSTGGGLRNPRPVVTDSPDEFEIIHHDLEDEGVFSPASLSDAREIAIRAIVQRRGQKNFRAKLVSAYDEACCITGESCIQVLEAAHIIPYSGVDTNHIQNGLLLRTDIHTLFDLHLIGVNPTDFKVTVSSTVKSSQYRALHGSKISLPSGFQHHPSAKSLAEHFSRCKK